MHRSPRGWYNKDNVVAKKTGFGKVKYTYLTLRVVNNQKAGRK